jgi:hypothetical protein
MLLSCHALLWRGPSNHGSLFYLGYAYSEAPQPTLAMWKCRGSRANSEGNGDDDADGSDEQAGDADDDWVNSMEP